MKDRAVASRYARALFEVAQEKGHEKAVAQGLASAVRVLKQEELLVRALNHPLMSLEQKKKVMLSSLPEKYSPLLERFLSRLIEAKRQDLLPAIFHDFDIFVQEAHGRLRAKVLSAIEINSPQKKQLENQLSSFTGKNVSADVSVDPDILGGVVVRIGDMVLDHSVRGQLRRLKERIGVRS